MNKSELKSILRESIKEVIFESGLLESLIVEVIKKVDVLREESSMGTVGPIATQAVEKEEKDPTKAFIRQILGKSEEEKSAPKELMIGGVNVLEGFEYKEEDDEPIIVPSVAKKVGVLNEIFKKLDSSGSAASEFDDLSDLNAEIERATEKTW